MCRIVTEDLIVVQNLVHLHLLQKSMNAYNISSEVTDALERKMGLKRVSK